MFSEANKICTQIVNEVEWKPIYRAVCKHREKLIQQKKCFINTASNLAQCNQKPINATICNSLEQFSNNIDCALRIMLDACTVEAQNVAVAVQDALNDDLILHHCYDETMINEKSIDDGEFKLNPMNERCSSEQENSALACLVELVEVNRKIIELNSLNFCMKLVNQIPLPLMGFVICIINMITVSEVRIGLSPICSERTRMLLRRNDECIQKIEHRTGSCQSGLNSLASAIHNMLQGIHSDAYLCNSYYLIRDAFECGEKIFIEMCTTDAVQNLQQLRQLLMELGNEEGCPEERPKNLDEIISRPTTTNSMITRPTSQFPTTCQTEEQKQFASCIQSITTFQPHPLAVIKQPKQIDEACKQFVEFKKCQTNISCHPLWAKGMTAMFNFACGSGYSTYIQVRQCIRKTTTREHIRKCVSEFSRSSPQIACQSSKKLLACSIPIINEKCGQVGAQFVTDYIGKFVSVVDPKCNIGMQQNDKSIMGYNCTAEQNARIDQCGAPINELASRIDELFEGGLQQFLANVKYLAPVFAEGCNLTNEFRHCLRPLIKMQSEQQCTVSSCLIQASNGVCSQPDTAKAIDDNLACVFRQASIPEFGKCLRSTIATLKQFNLIALRRVLPQFIKCVEHIVVQNCGQTPVNILRAISANDICPILLNDQLISVNYDISQGCNSEVQQKHAECVGEFYRNYRMLPITLLRDPSNIDMLCIDASKLITCSYLACETNKQKALNSLVEFICMRRDMYKKHSMCLTSVITSPQGSKCLASFLAIASDQQCSFLTSVANCAAPHIYNTCGYEALTLSFEGMHIFANRLNKSCNIQIPIASVKTSCNEAGIIEYLQCENFIDHFTFTPFSFISLETMLSCAASELSAQCTEQALKHVVSMLLIWVRKFDPSCSISISGYNMIKNSKTEEDFSLDSGPTHISIDQTISSFSSSNTQSSIIATSSFPEFDSDLSASNSFPESTTSNMLIPEFELQTIPQSKSAPASDTEFIQRTDMSSTILSILESNTEPTSTVDSTLSVQPSLGSSSEPESNTTVNSKTLKMKESGQICGTSSNLWIWLIIIILPTAMHFVQ
ncbi:Protein F44E2.4 [Dirofilaria immitis]|nr:Protein F44E2.4 [Dirofilaria immitis]